MPPPMNRTSTRWLSPVAELLRRSRDEPSRVALVAEDRAWSCAQLAAASARVAAGLLGRGVRVGDRVALHLYNTSDAVLALLACLRIGAVAVPMNTQLTTPELRDLLNRTRPVLYLGEQDLSARLAAVPEDLLPRDARVLATTPRTTPGGTSWRHLAGEPLSEWGCREVSVAPEAPALLLSTSGSTGTSKIVVWSHRNVAALHLSGEGRGIGRADVLPILTPVMHGSGAYHLFTALAQGAVAVLIDPFEPGAVLDAMHTHRVTTLFGLPFMCSALAREQRARPRELGTLRSGFVSGDNCPAEIVSEFAQAFDAPLRSFWASTEDVGSTIAATEPGPYLRPIPEARVRVVDTDGQPAARGAAGEMLISSPTTTPGYWSGPGSYIAMPDGAFHTGDLVRELEPGLLEYLGRAKDIIVSGGANISPHEIEQALRSHPGVLDAGAAGLPDPILGQRIGALVVLTAEASQPSVHDLTTWLGERLAAWKLPHHLHAIDTIPRNALTKIDRAAVQRTLTRLASVPERS